MRIAEKLQPILATRYGLRSESWRMNLARVGYLGGVTFLSVLDELTQHGNLHGGELVCSVAEESSKWMCAGTVFRWNPSSAPSAKARS
jgi:3-oxoacyl-[acyl-carrier-protein] synthase III